MVASPFLTGSLLLRFLEKAPIGLTLVDPQGRVMYASPWARNLLRLSGGSIMDCHAPDLQPKVQKKLAELVTCPAPAWHRIIQVGERWIENQFFPLRLEDEFDGVVIVIVSHDVTEQERLYRALETSHHHLDRMYRSVARLAVTDGLTGLYNRRYLEQVIRRQGKEPARPAAVMMVDINKFKSVNDRWGHQRGDWLLVETARLLKAAVRENDLVFRYGGDEFLVLLPGCGLSEAAEVAERLQAKAAAWNHKHGDAGVELGLAVGFAAGDSNRLADVIHQADQAMYDQKA